MARRRLNGVAPPGQLKRSATTYHDVENLSSRMACAGSAQLCCHPALFSTDATPRRRSRSRRSSNRSTAILFRPRSVTHCDRCDQRPATDYDRCDSDCFGFADLACGACLPQTLQGRANRCEMKTVDNASPNKSLDRSGGSVFRIKSDAAKVA